MNKKKTLFKILSALTVTFMLSSCNHFFGKLTPGDGLSDMSSNRLERKLDKADEFSRDTVASSFYKGALHFSSGKARVQVNGKWGIVDYYNRFVIPAEYDSLSRFWNGWALAVQDGKKTLLSPHGNEFYLPEEMIFYNQSSSMYEQVIVKPEERRLLLKSLGGLELLQTEFGYGLEDYQGRKVPVLTVSDNRFFSERYYYVDGVFEGDNGSILVTNTGIWAFLRLAYQNRFISATSGRNHLYLLPNERSLLSGTAFTVEDSSLEYFYLNDVFSYSSDLRNEKPSYVSVRWSFKNPRQSPEWFPDEEFTCSGQTIRYKGVTYTIDESPKYDLNFFHNLLYSLNYDNFKSFFDVASQRLTNGIWTAKDSTGSSELAFWGDGTRGTWEWETYNPGLPTFGISGGYSRSGDTLNIQYTADLSHDTWKISYQPLYINLYGEYNVYLQGIIRADDTTFTRYL